MGTIAHIFIAHARGEPMLALPQVEALTDQGLSGDRYADALNRRSPDYQLTMIELECITAFTAQLGLPLAVSDPRRNLVTTGISLNPLCGKRFRVGAVELEGLELCEPCATFGRRTHLEVIPFFVHRGGLRCKILRGGTIKIGDAVSEALSEALPI